MSNVPRIFNNLKGEPDSVASSYDLSCGACDNNPHFSAVITGEPDVVAPLLHLLCSKCGVERFTIEIGRKEPK